MSTFTTSVENIKIEDFDKWDKTKLKNPFIPSTNPFKDGQKVTFEGFVVVHWQTDDNHGDYLAIKFKNVPSSLSLSVFKKTDIGYPTMKLDKAEGDDGEPKEFSNEGGLAAIVADFTSLTKENLQAIKDFCTKSAKNLKIKLTPYYNEQWSKVHKHTLTNLVKE